MPKFIVGARLHDYGKGSPDELFGRVAADGFAAVQRFFAAFNPLRCLVDRCRSAVYNLSYRIAKHSKGEYG